MPAPPASDSGDGDGRLQRCIRDLAALNALPSMCVGRSPDEALDIVMDALPTVLGCDLVYLALPGSPAPVRARFRGAPASDAQLAELAAVTAAEADGSEALVVLGGERLWCLEAEVPIASERGRLLAGRARALEADTDRVLVRTAANVVGTTLATANELETARRKDEFLAILGHELRNPLAPIATAVELLARNPSADRERQVIARHTRHLARLVDDLLDISRVTRGFVELRSEQVTLASVLERAVEIATPLIMRRHHRLEVAPGARIPLRGDPVRLAQVFGNLLTNAAKFTPAGGRIQVLVDPTPGRVRVTVRDNGRGIAPDQQTRIFEPFVQAEHARDAGSGGLGLGLAIVANLVERHGGTITVASDGPGQGAAFTAELPTDAVLEPAVEAPRPQASAARAQVRVLVVDDDSDIASLLSEALSDEGFQTAVANDGQGALDRWRTFIPHAAVLDVGLPDLDGYELAKTLRLRHGKSATLIAATGYGRERDRARSADAGFDCHLVKPVSVDDLVSLLDERVVAAATGRSEPPPA
jgi:signal transduction histidine kinase/CheY-like chemotaxis protein